VLPVKYELGSYIPEDDIFRVTTVIASNFTDCWFGIFFDLEWRQ
jgi:hypothetical protein